MRKKSQKNAKNYDFLYFSFLILQNLDFIVKIFFIDNYVDFLMVI